MMRDIKPAKTSRDSVDYLPPHDLPPDARKLYQKRSPRKKRSLAGASVPVANINAPKTARGFLRSKHPKKDEYQEEKSSEEVKQSSSKQGVDVIGARTHGRYSKKTYGKERDEKPAQKGALGRTPTPSSPRLGQKERSIIFVLTSITIVLVVLAAFVFLPSANIEMILKTAPLLVDQEVTLSASDAASDDTIPGRKFEREANVEGASPVVSSHIVGTKATGTVQIINKTVNEQKVKEQSRLATKDGTIFFMQSHAILPPASSGTPTSATVSVEAAEPGEAGNIAPQRLDFVALEAESKAVLYAEATKRLSGGSGQEVKIVKEPDLEQARNAAGQAAKQQVEQSIRAELPQGWTILEESWDQKVASFNSDIAIDNQKDTIPYTARINVRVMAYEEPRLEEKITKALNARLDKDYMLFPGPISYTKAVKNIDWDSSKAVITARVTHTTVPTFSVDTLQSKLARRTQQEAKEYLEGLQGVESVTVELWPFWVRRITPINKRISIEFISNRQP